MKRQKEPGLEKSFQGRVIRSLKNVELPEFDLDDPHVKAWIENQIAEYRKKIPGFGLQNLRDLILEKTTFSSENEVFIDDDELFVVGGEICVMAPDLKDLPEIDYDDPAVIKWMDQQEAESIRKYGRLTSEQLDYMYNRRLELQKIHSEKSVEELNKMALLEYVSSSVHTKNRNAKAPGL